MRSYVNLLADPAVWSRRATSPGSFGAALSNSSPGLVGERWNGLSGPEVLPGVDDLLGSFRWDDAVCIIQDDLEDWNRESRIMGDIYRNAICTIAAHSASGDDNGYRDC